MLKSHEKFHSANGKRLVLIVDDEIVNRELLGGVLKNEYEIIYASNGQEAMERIREFKDTLSIVLLDLMMPVMSGTEVLKTIKSDPEMQQIPVIVLTSDQESEIESLKLGAIDFIPKPYPQRKVILARVLRTIELSEDKQTTYSAERDPLTGLYNREAFYRYAEQFDQQHRDLEMDAIVVDVNHFHMINERFGTAYGDEMLRHIGERVSEMVVDSGGVVCRSEADTFMVYCPHGNDYKAILENAAIGLAGDNPVNSRIRLRMGVYACVDKALEIERRFDRAKIAADTVRSSFTKTIGIYDDKLHENELYHEQLIEDFHKAINEGQFKVFYQPKFDVRTDEPLLASAEALVRWQHPTLGMISPGVFIPLFEDNGLIQELDSCVWEQTAAQIAQWREKYGFSFQVSANISRIDMYDPELILKLRRIIEKNSLEPGALMLEITESAYTQDSGQIIETVNKLREIGFRIEMDDFGTGYSSLNMISALPIDALRLDMQFLRNAFSERKDTRMLEVIIDIADYLSVPVIAEGVETEEQLSALKTIGCDLVQGYLFSKPVPAKEFERFFTEYRLDGDVPANGGAAKKTQEHEQHSNAFGRIAQALTDSFERVYYVDTENNRYLEFSSGGENDELRIECSGADFFEDIKSKMSKRVFAPDIEKLSHALSRDNLLCSLKRKRSYSILYRLTEDGRPVYYDLKAVFAAPPDEHHIVIGIRNVDEQLIQAEQSSAAAESADILGLARTLSMGMERLYDVRTATGDYTLFETRDGRSGKSSRKGSFFADFGESVIAYAHGEDRPALAPFTDCQSLAAALDKEGEISVQFRYVRGGSTVYYQLKAVVCGNKDNGRVLVAMSNIDAQMKYGAQLATAIEQAYRDPLTGVKSRHAFNEAEKQWDDALGRGEAEPFAIVWCDVNGLKEINDTLGHREGDRYLCDACRIICNVFKHSPVYRVGGDEFIAILSGEDYNARTKLIAGFTEENKKRAAAGGVKIACGMAEAEEGRDSTLKTVLERADAAMYENKKLLKTMS